MKQTTDRQQAGDGVTDWRKARRRKRGTGCLIRRGKTFYARVVIAGRVIVRSLHTGDVRKAQTAFDDFMRPYELGNRARTLENLQTRIGGVAQELAQWECAQPSLAVADAFTAYERSGARPMVKRSTLETYANDFNVFEKWIAANRPNVRELRQFTQADAAEYAQELRATVAPGTYNRRITLFRAIWRTLADDDSCKSATATDRATLPARLTCNPWERLKRLDDCPAARRELTVEELRKVCTSVTGEMRTLFAVGVYTGLRLGDCATLEWGNVDMVRRIVSVIPRKTERHAHGKQTIIPIHPALFSVLSETPPERRAGYVMPKLANDYERGTGRLTHHTQRIFERCGIKTHADAPNGQRRRAVVSFHSLRHTFVSMSANAGVPLALVQAIVGHSSPAMTRHYFHESADALKMAVAALPDVGGTLHAAPAPEASRGEFAALLDGMTRERLRALRGAIDARLAIA